MLKRTFGVLTAFILAGLLTASCYAQEKEGSDSIQLADSYETVTKALQNETLLDTSYIPNQDFKVIATTEKPTLFGKELNTMLIYFFKNVAVRIEMDFKDPSCKEEIIKLMGEINEDSKKLQPKTEKTEWGEVTSHIWESPVVKISVVHTKMSSGKELLKVTNEINL